MAYLTAPRPSLEDQAIERLHLEPVDERITRWLSLHSVPLLRISLGLVFAWFGALKLIPGASPAAGLVGDTLSAMSFGLMRPELSLPVIGLWEVAIGLGLLSGKFLRLTLLLLALQMVGTLTPLFLFPDRTFNWLPFAPTLEGQYILKNAVLIAGALVVGSTVRHRAGE